MKAIILAAGRGARLGKYGEGRPKCMIDFDGKPIIQWQIEMLRSRGITDIVVVTGYMAETIKIPGVTYVHDVDGTNPATNMVHTLFCARKEFDDDLILLYGDVLFESTALDKLISSQVQISIVADDDFEEFWIMKNKTLWDGALSFQIGDNDKIIAQGKKNPLRSEMHARYVGMIKFSKGALPKILDTYDELSKNFRNTPWRFAQTFPAAFMTDFLQELIDRGLTSKAVKIKRGWLEFDTPEDYELTHQWLKDGTLKKYFNDDLIRV